MGIEILIFGSLVRLYKKHDDPKLVFGLLLDQGIWSQVIINIYRYFRAQDLEQKILSDGCNKNISQLPLRLFKWSNHPFATVKSIMFKCFAIINTFFRKLNHLVDIDEE